MFGDMSTYEQYFNTLKILGVFPYKIEKTMQGKLLISWYTNGPWLWLAVLNFSIIVFGLTSLYVRFSLALLSPKELTISELVAHILWTCCGTWVLSITLLNIRKRKSLCIILTRVCNLERRLGKFWRLASC